MKLTIKEGDNGPVHQLVKITGMDGNAFRYTVLKSVSARKSKDRTITYIYDLEPGLYLATGGREYLGFFQMPGVVGVTHDKAFELARSGGLDLLARLEASLKRTCHDET